jgi:general secretion pathway protein A
VYLEHFGFTALPFENVPDPAFFFDEGEYQRILRRLTSAVAAGRGLMVVAGPIGSGKTTLSQKLMAGLPGSTRRLWLAEPAGSDRELLEMILERLGTRLVWDSRVRALGALRERLVELHAAGGQCLVIVDESHKFSDEGLEAIRLLNNLEEGGAKLIQVLMLGQEELTAMLTVPGREAFRQRIANFEVLGRMKPPQLCEYVRHRLRVAGGDPTLFPDLVLEAVAEAAGGIPRLTNSLCDRALLYAYESGKSAVDAKEMLRAAEDVGVHRKAFHFLVGRTPAASVPPPPAPPAVEVAPVIAPPAVVADEPVSPPASPQAETGAIRVDSDRKQDAAGQQQHPPAPLTWPLVFLATGIAALTASLSFYCSRSAAVDGAGCLSHLLRGIFGN